MNTRDFTNDEQNMNESHFGAVMKRYQNVQMNPEEKREVFKQTMLVIEKIEAVSLAHGDLNRAMRPTSAFAEDENLFANTVSKGNSEIRRQNQSGFMRAASVWVSYVRQRQFIPALLTAVVFLFTGGTSVLAERSLPGDSLYSIKVNVNEPIRELAAVSTEAKANVAVEATERRLQEAAVLSAEGRLDESNTKILQNQFSKNASQVRNQVASLTASNDDLAAAEISEKFAITLSAHSKILGTLAGGDSVSADILAISPVDTPASSTPLDTISTNVTIASSGDPVTPTSTPSVVATITSSPLPPVQSVTTGALSAPVNSLLQAVKAELDTTKTTREGIEAQANATIANTQADQPSTATKAALDSVIQGIKFSLNDITTELDAHKFDTKAFVYAPTTVEFAKKRIDAANIALTDINNLAKENLYAEAVKKGRVSSRSLSEVLVVLKIEKSTKGSLEGKLSITSLINDVTAEDATNTPAI